MKRSKGKNSGFEIAFLFRRLQRYQAHRQVLKSFLRLENWTLFGKELMELWAPPRSFREKESPAWLIKIWTLEQGNKDKISYGTSEHKPFLGIKKLKTSLEVISRTRKHMHWVQGLPLWGPQLPSSRYTLVNRIASSRYFVDPRPARAPFRRWKSSSIMDFSGFPFVIT